MTDSTLSASRWYTKLSNNGTDPQTLEAFECWLSEDPENEIEYLECEIAMIALDGLAQDVRLSEFVSSTVSDLRESRPCSVMAMKSRFFKNTLGFSLMSLGGFCSILLALFLFFDRTMDRPDMEYYVTGVGEQKTITLNDGSQVSLNTDTKLQVDYSENRRYLRLLQGEAVFNVNHDPRRPFDVSAGSRLVRAIGTSFNIYIDERKVTISVLEGEVKLQHISQPALDKNDKVLASGYSATYKKLDGEALTITENEDHSRINAWLAGRLAFSDWRLIDAIREHNRYSVLKIHLQDKQSGERKIAGIFDIGDTESFISALQEAFDFDIKKDDDDIWLVPRSDP